ncbi:zf-TFIIB domain-containing protein [Nocardioides sp. cx-173]|nr:zf-TFIIB domain-containing protein [Nocardioides sp. cx-173]MCD4525536.1 zf-TFIIB domain-containing protein [Nocardioides sp. cx-173]UGB42680.1 zf-TFIIB domain-containing protein [Nocardioides sp. cx-173]
MQCPTDGTTLTMSERSGIEIDYCPSCRGVWLDRGELDKLIERSVAQQAPPAPAPQQPSRERSYERYEEPRHHEQGYERGYQQQGYKKKRKESWLSEIFD